MIADAATGVETDGATEEVSAEVPDDVRDNVSGATAVESDCAAAQGTIVFITTTAIITIIVIPITRLTDFIVFHPGRA